MANQLVFPPNLGNHPQPDSLITEVDLSGGVQRDLAQHNIKDNEAFYIQDGLMPKPGYLQGRGSMAPLPGSAFIASSPNRIEGVTSFVNSAGVLRYLFLVNNNVNLKVFLTDSTLATVTEINTSTAATLADPGAVFDAHPCQSQEILVSMTKTYKSDQTASHQTYRWKGAIKANYLTGTITSTLNSAVITGAGTLWSANIEPGMYIIETAGNIFRGIVKTVNSDTQITLEEPWQGLAGAGTAYVAKSIMGFPQFLEIAQGRITTSTGSAIVNGGDTKFVDQGVLTAKLVFVLIGDVYKVLGTTNTIQSNTQLTLAANANFSVTNAKYFIHSINVAESVTSVTGTFTAYWNGMQFFFNKDAPPSSTGTADLGTLYIADSQRLTAIDTSREGDFLKLPQTNASNFGVGLCGTETGLLAFRENETYLITGNSPNTLRATKILDDGCYSNMAVVPYKSGAIWPGRKGIYYFDGVRTRNILDLKAQDYWISSLANQDMETYRMWAFEQQDHYILQAEYGATIQMIKSSVHDHQGWCMNMRGEKLSFLSNLAVRGATRVPKLGTVFAFQGNSPFGGATQGCLVLASDLFKPAVAGEKVGYGWVAYSSGGPRFFAETKSFDAGRPEIKKRWKQFQIWANTNQALVVSVFTGLDKTNIVNLSSLPGSFSAWLNKKLRFMGSSTHISLQLECPSDATGAIQIGPFALEFRPMRVGRI